MSITTIHFLLQIIHRQEKFYRRLQRNDQEIIKLLQRIDQQIDRLEASQGRGETHNPFLYLFADASTATYEDCLINNPIYNYCCKW